MESNLRASPEPSITTESTGTPINDPANDLEWQKAFDLSSQEENTPSILDHLFDSPSDEIVAALEEPANKNISPLSEKREPIIAQDARSISNDPINGNTVGQEVPAPNRPSQYINRLKSFQNNLERRFGSLETVNVEKGKPYFDRGMEERMTQSATRKETKHSNFEKNALELLESFLFTANQKRINQ